MSDFLLIHGSCHGAWCWRDLIPALQALGHTARAIDLPGNGDDQTPLDQVTLDSTRDAILDSLTPGTLLLGHSWAGHPISAAAEADPHAMHALIYLCTYVPLNGLSMVDMRKRGPRQTLDGAVHRDAAGISYTLAPERVEDLFYQDCPPGTLAYAEQHLCPQAIAPQNTPITLRDNFASVPKAYIRCADDHTIPPEYQESMTAGWPPENVHVMPTGHSPFFADPSGLATLLNTIARRF
ncbi:MAG: pimeloyl-ACP methyl ester carboxylesterase [Paracoccaceae bacterium]|jgi:pimeloyl-ACP methyl ester carboxylesterase